MKNGIVWLVGRKRCLNVEKYVRLIRNVLDISRAEPKAAPVAMAFVSNSKRIPSSHEVQGPLRSGLQAGMIPLNGLELQVPVRGVPLDVTPWNRVPVPLQCRRSRNYGSTINMSSLEEVVWERNCVTSPIIARGISPPRTRSAPLPHIGYVGERGGGESRKMHFCWGEEFVAFFSIFHPHGKVGIHAPRKH